MNITFYRRLSLWLSLTTIAVVGGGSFAQAETMAPDQAEASAKLSVDPKMSISSIIENSDSVQEAVTLRDAVPGTTATAVDALTSQATAETASPLVAQTGSDTAPSPGIDTTPTPSSEPAPTTPTAPVVAPAATSTSFSDVDANYWASPFIQGLTTRGVLAGFPDGTFRPNQPVTRAQFAAMLRKAFTQNQQVQQLPPGGFTDVPADYWAAPAIQSAYETGFLSGYPDNTFAPNQQIPKVQAITSLASGLQLPPSGTTTDILSNAYTDAAQIPNYALNGVAAATENNVVVNYPDVKTLNPQLPLTRAEAAAHIYQALVKLGQVAPLSSTVAAASYIVGGPGGVAQTPTAPTTPTTPTPTPTDNAAAAAAAYGIGNYIGAGVNIGVLGNDTALGNTNFTVFSKFRLLKSFPVSFRPAVVIGDNTTFLIPVTFDIPLQATNIPILSRLPIYPYIGGGIIIPTGSNDVGPLITAGFDYRLNSRFTATAGVNVGFSSGDAQLGVLLGIGYNFGGFAGF